MHSIGASAWVAAVDQGTATLVKLLSGDDAIRSLEWLARDLGMTEPAVAELLPDVKAHGVLMSGGKEGATLDSRHGG